MRFAIMVSEPTTISCQRLMEIGPLNLAYFAVQALLFRALMSPARMSAKTDPTSSLCRYFDSAVAEFRSFTLFMDRITRVTLHAFWGGRMLH
jgi:NCS1 family nucleobase:cation symporter-1